MILPKYTLVCSYQIIDTFFFFLLMRGGGGEQGGIESK